MIKTLSPYYLNVPLSDGGVPFDYYIFTLYVWTGLQSSEPATASYQLTRQNPTQSITTDKVNISNLINDFIEFESQTATTTSLIDGVNQVWVSAYYEGFIDDVSSGVVQLVLDNAISGYNYGMDGENATVPTNKILLSGSEFKVNADSSFIIPLIGNDTSVTVISYPDNEINEDINVPISLDSSEVVSYLWVQCSETSQDNLIEVIYNGVTISLFLKNEYRYTPIDIHFKNKEGTQQVLTFFKERKDNIKVTGETYNGSGGQPINGFHQKVDYNKNGTASFVASSGFVDEENNDTFKQLLLSDKVWQYDGSIMTPLNIGSKGIEYKSQVNDKLINYTIEFEYSFNEINDI
jgi:hypothetical protein